MSFSLIYENKSKAYDTFKRTRNPVTSLGHIVANKNKLVSETVDLPGYDD
jgi:hypothetical protein